MTCNFESVEFRTTHLLRSIANRRVSLLSFNVSAESQNVAISWNIKIEEQLRQWALDQSNEIIKMLNKLRDQQDMTLKCNEHWIILQIEHIKRLKQLEINHTSMNTLEEINTRLQEKILSLKDKIKEVQRSVNQFQSWQSTESWSTTNHLSQQNIELHASIENHTWRETSTKFTSFENEHHWFYKFSNSFIFIDEDELTWKDWRNKMNDKLIVNIDQFDDETIYIVYMMSRLEDDVAKHIFAWHCFDSSNSFTSIYELFDHLKEIYDELNKNRKSRREYCWKRNTYAHMYEHMYEHMYAHTYISTISYFRFDRSDLTLEIFIRSFTSFFICMLYHMLYLLDSQYIYMHIFALTLIYQ